MFIFMYSKKYGYKFICCAYEYTIVPKSLAEKTRFSLMNYFCQKSIVYECMEIFLWDSILFHRSIYMSLFTLPPHCLIPVVL